MKKPTMLTFPGTRRPFLLGGLALVTAAAAFGFTPAHAAPPGTTAGWTQTFDDEFNNSSPNSSIDMGAWFPTPVYDDNNTNYNIVGGTELYRPNNFLPVAYYRAQNVFEDGSGNVALNTVREDYNPNSGNFYSYGLQHYTSAWMVTRNFQQAYGYFEVRMKTASTPGIDSGFWLLQGGTSKPEIDIVENPSGSGNGGFPGGGYTVSQGYIPSSGSAPLPWLTSSGTSFAADYHTYGLDWEPDHMTWYVDGAEKLKVFNNIPSEAVHMLLSSEVERDTDQLDQNNPGYSYTHNPPPDQYDGVAVGNRDGNPNGSWFGDPDEGTYPATTLVDYVRVWKKNPLPSVPIGHRIGLRAGITGKYASTNLSDNTYLEASWADAVYGWETFDVVDAGGGNIGLRSEATGGFVSVDFYQSNRVLRDNWATSIGAWETFQWVNQGDGTFGLKSNVNGLYVSCNIYDGNHLEALWAQSIGSWEQFTYTDEGTF